MFADAIEASAQKRPVRVLVSAYLIAQLGKNFKNGAEKNCFKNMNHVDV